MRPYTFAQRLKQIMDERNLSQADVVRLCEPYCKRFGVKLNKSEISQYLSQKTGEPRQNKISVISYGLAVSEAWLMGFDVPKERMTPIPLQTEDGRDERMRDLFQRLSVKDQDEIISLIEWKLSRK